MHRRSYFLPNLDDIECDDYRAIFSEKVGRNVVPLGSYRMCVEGKMVNFSPTIPINLFHVPCNVENVYIGADCSPDEIKEYTELFKYFHDIFACAYEEMPGSDLVLSNMRLRPIRM